MISISSNPTPLTYKTVRVEIRGIKLLGKHEAEIVLKNRKGLPHIIADPADLWDFKKGDTLVVKLGRDNEILYCLVSHKSRK